MCFTNKVYCFIIIIIIIIIIPRGEMLEKPTVPHASINSIPFMEMSLSHSTEKIVVVIVVVVVVVVRWSSLLLLLLLL